MDVNSFVYISTGNFSEVFQVRFERKLKKFKPVIVVNPTLQGKKKSLLLLKSTRFSYSVLPKISVPQRS